MSGSAWPLFGALILLILLLPVADLLWLYFARRWCFPASSTARAGADKAGEEGTSASDDAERARETEAQLLRAWGRARLLLSITIGSLAALVVLYFILLVVKD